jgi:hypothetical protein
MTDTSGSSNFFGKVLEGMKIYPKEAKADLLNMENQEYQIKLQRLQSSQMLSVNGSNKSNRLDAQVEVWMERRSNRIRGQKIVPESQKVLTNQIPTLKAILLSNRITLFILLCFVFILLNTTLIFIQFWLAMWTTDTLKLEFNTYLYTYIGLFMSVGCI